MSTDLGQWKHPTLLAFSVKSILIVWKIFKYFKHKETLLNLTPKWKLKTLPLTTRDPFYNSWSQNSDIQSDLFASTYSDEEQNIMKENQCQSLK